MLKEEWAQKKSSELIRLARVIGSVLNEQRDNEEEIIADQKLLKYHGLEKHLKKFKKKKMKK